MPYLSPILSFSPILQPEELGPGSSDVRGSSTPASAVQSDLPPAGSHVLVTDAPDAGGAFVLTHFLQVALRLRVSRTEEVVGWRFGRRKGSELTQLERRNVVWVGCDGQGLEHWSAVFRKAGINVRSRAVADHFHFIDAASCLLTAESTHGLQPMGSRAPVRQIHPALKKVYDLVEDALRNFSTIACGTHAAESGRAGATPRKECPAAPQDYTADTILIIDDLSSLSWLLSPVGPRSRASDEVARWARSLRLLSEAYHSSLVTLLHASSTSLSPSFAQGAGGSIASTCDLNDERMIRASLRTADIWVEIRELKSGRARDCTGEITIHPLVRPRLAQSYAHHPEFPPGIQTTAENKPPLSAFGVNFAAGAQSMLYHVAPDAQRGAGGNLDIGAALEAPLVTTSSRRATLSGQSPTESSEAHLSLTPNMLATLKEADAALIASDRSVRIWARGHM